ncbi:MAG: phosphoenolpyruvate carboxykinase (GTP), partial [Actinobacteria bacterium]|nr:phosphoenolpyruvate carboxykinase (GTP) [Actinomycetota bacterium]
ARVEHLTYVCTRSQADAGPNNNWMAPDEAHTKMRALFSGCMRGRTLYVIPYCMGPLDSPYARCGVEITDSAYVVLNMAIMTRIGRPALERIARSGQFVKGLHSTGELDPARRFIMHFPEELSIESFGSGYGGNALLGKKCHALRIASWQARTEGWLAEHMLIVGLQNPRGETHYVAAAFPSACGKTNLAMLVPTLPGWSVETIGDDIAWMKFGADGMLHAINPEFGFFGVAPGTNMKTNPNAMLGINANTVFTNTALTDDLDVWWEGMTDEPPAHCTDWRRDEWTPERETPAAHPNSRFCAPAGQCPVIAPEWEDPDGVPISAILFGGRRAGTVPLVFESRDWRHGVFVGASMGSERTAAAFGKVGELRFDPFAMVPFCGYHMADYFSHWLSMTERTDESKLPRIYGVNWFRRGADGRFLWPGYGENSRVLAWIFGRITDDAGARQTPIGMVPRVDDLVLDGLDIPKADVAAALEVDADEWRDQLPLLEQHFESFGAKLPEALREELIELKTRLDAR